MTPYSLYSAIKVACLVQRAKDRLKSCIKKCLPPPKPDKSPYCPRLQTHACKSISSAVKAHSRSTSVIGRIRRTILAQRRKSDIPSLFDELDFLLQPGALPLRAVSANDYLFIKHDFHLASLTISIDKLYDIHGLTTALLGRLQDYSGSNIQLIHKGGNDGLSYGELEGGKFIANLEHLLRCLGKIALDAILHYYLTIVEAHILHWHHYWQYQKRIDEGWFAEWPNGQRPLSTTWPWNVKPSLLVLWGVCWMFYGSSGFNTRTTRNRRGAGGPLNEDVRTGQIAEQHQPEASQQHSSAAYEFPTHTGQIATLNNSQSWAGSAPNIYPNFSWPHPHQAASHTRRANNPNRNSVSGYEPGSPYIVGTSNVSSDLFPAASTSYWAYCQGINQDPSPAYAPSYAPWLSTYNTGEDLVTTSQRSRSDPNIRSYGPPPQVANPQATAGSLSSLGFSLGVQMQNYPSPHSDVSRQTTSPCLSVVPGAMISPSMPLASPSVAGSSNSLHSSRRSQEPPRNTEGLMYCDSIDCAEQPPVFARKCEWTKHMDKHNRPYVCEERGCENIKGFTYSGGLSRHQREVHRQHGGPKASCHCPHKDCKRSTGVGFSRKENLHEHLRRVHRDVGADQMEEPDTLSNEVSFVSGTRKRRRAAPVEDQDDENDLEQEVKKLRKELQEKDKRLERLEQVVARLQNSQQK